MTQPIQIALSGAAGRIGYSLVFRIAAGGIFGGEQPIALRLLESPGAGWDRLRAMEMELRDCAFPLMADLAIGTNPVEVFRGSDWVVLLGGHPLREGMRRSDLLRENAPIFADHGRAINEAAPTARIMVVANPCNANCLLAKSFAENVPADHWFALNRVDRMRATSLLAEKAGVPVSRVTRLTVWGNHSELVYPDFRNAFIDGRPAPEVITDTAWVREQFEPTVSNRSREILHLCGASPAATAAQAILGTIRAITLPTPFERRFGASVVSDGSYGVPRGLIFGFPLYSEDGRTWKIVQGLYHDAYAQERLAQNVAEIEHEMAIVNDLLGNVR